MSFLASAIAGFTGGVLASQRLELPFFIGSLSAIVASLVVFTCARGRGEVGTVEKRKYWEFLKRGARVLVQAKPLILLTVSSFFIVLAVPCFNLIWAPYMKTLGAAEWLLGAACTIFLATAGVGSFIGGRLAKRIGYKKTAILAASMLSISFIALFLATNLHTYILAALLYEIGFGFLNPTLGAWINEFIPSEERATVISLRRTILLPFSALGMAAMGIISDTWSPRYAYIFGSATIALAIPFYAKVPRGRLCSSSSLCTTKTKRGLEAEK